VISRSLRNWVSYISCRG